MATIKFTDSGFTDIIYERNGVKIANIPKLGALIQVNGNVVTINTLGDLNFPFDLNKHTITAPGAITTPEQLRAALQVMKDNFNLASGGAATASALNQISIIAVLASIRDLTGSQDKECIARYLDTNGDGTGTKNAIGNYAVQQIFSIKPPAGETYVLDAMLISIAADADLKRDKYGKNAVLVNGIEVRKQDNGGTLCDYTDGIPVIVNQDWGRNTAILDLEETLNKRRGFALWEFTRSRSPLVLVGDDNERLEILLEDDFSSLDEHYFYVQGFKL